jgi:hypothetical protein
MLTRDEALALLRANVEALGVIADESDVELAVKALAAQQRGLALLLSETGEVADEADDTEAVLIDMEKRRGARG